MKFFRIRNSIITLLLVAVLISGDVFAVMADDQSPDAAGETYTVDENDSAIPAADEEAGQDEAIEASDDDFSSEEEAADPSEQPSIAEDETEGENDVQDADVPDQPDAEIEEEADPVIIDEDGAEQDAAAESEDALAEDEASDKEEEIEKAKATEGEYLFELDGNSNEYSVSIKNFSTTDEFTGIEAKVWSNVNGDDDAKTLELQFNEEIGVYSQKSGVSDFKNYGTATAEFYLVNNETKTLLETKTLTIKAPKLGEYTVTADKKTGSIIVDVKKITGSLAIEKINILVWRDAYKNRKVYTVDASEDGYKKTVFIGDFGGYAGTYNVRINAVPLNGNEKTLVTEIVSFDEYNGASSFVDRKTNDIKERYYQLRIRGLARKKGISSVEFEVWNKNASGKKKTYKAKFNSSSGYYYSNMDIKSFKKAGQYIMNVYVVQKDGKKVNVKKKNIMNISGEAGGTAKKRNPQPTKGKVGVSMSVSDFTAPSGVDSVKYTAWTTDNKSDKYTYTATKKDDGTFLAYVNIANHNYNNNKIYVQPIVTMGNGVVDKQDQVVIYFKAQDVIFVQKTEKGRRTIGIAGPSFTDNVRFKVWGTKNGTNDAKWYKARTNWKTRYNKYTAEVIIYNHKETGTYKVQAYSGNTLLGETSFKATKEDLKKNGYFYEKGYKFYYVDGKLQKEYRNKVKGPYIIKMNRTQCTITIYAKDGKNGYIQPIAYFPCSPGTDATPSPIGSYKLHGSSRWKYWYTWDNYCQYAVHYATGKFFHSAIYAQPNIYTMDPSTYNGLGHPASHGCVRLRVVDCKWIFDHKSEIKEFQIYEGSDPGPFGKAPHTKIPATQTWDPTDPLVKK